MNRQDRINLFDRWADQYDPLDRDEDSFPFGGYEQVLDEVLRLAEPAAGQAVLDVGIGAGALAARFVELGCQAWGIDFSTEMLTRARKRLPRTRLLQCDLLGQWPTDLDRMFDRIVSAYVLHEFDLATKVRLLSRFANHHLRPDGLIVIGDAGFPTVEAREEGRKRWAESWDEDEHYWAADEAIAAMTSAGLHTHYQQVSPCAGVYVIRPEQAG